MDYCERALLSGSKRMTKKAVPPGFFSSRVLLFSKRTMMMVVVVFTGMPSVQGRKGKRRVGCGGDRVWVRDALRES